MGCFDTIKVDDKEGQVKCWSNDLKLYKQFDTAPGIDDNIQSYSIAMREGGYVNIVFNKIVSWTNYPICNYIIDKYGCELDELVSDKTKGGILPDEKYLFDEDLKQGLK